jgi:hypothetical protein
MLKRARERQLQAERDGRDALAARRADERRHLEASLAQAQAQLQRDQENSRDAWATAQQPCTLEHPREITEAPCLSMDALLDQFVLSTIAEVQTELQSARPQTHAGISPEMIEATFKQCRLGQYREVEEALGVGVPVEARSGGNKNTMLLECAQNGQKRIAKLLLRNRADINAQNSRGDSALHCCYRFNYVELGEYLRSKGADDAICNSVGKSCYDFGRERTPVLNAEHEQNPNEESMMHWENPNRDDDEGAASCAGEVLAGEVMVGSEEQSTWEEMLEVSVDNIVAGAIADARSCLVKQQDAASQAKEEVLNGGQVAVGSAGDSSWEEMLEMSVDSIVAGAIADARGILVQQQDAASQAKEVLDGGQVAVGSAGDSSGKETLDGEVMVGRGSAGDSSWEEMLEEMLEVSVDSIVIGAIADARGSLVQQRGDDNKASADEEGAGALDATHSAHSALSGVCARARLLFCLAMVHCACMCVCSCVCLCVRAGGRACVCVRVRACACVRACLSMLHDWPRH